jgi:hypothetical protein
MDRMLLVLKRSSEQESARQALLDQQHDKSSANYHRWLTPDEFGQQFGPADQDIQAVTSWLQSRGFQVARVGRGRTAIEFSGTAAQVRDAFRTEIHSYLVGGAQHWANGSDPQIPAALAPVVSGVAALHNFPVKPLHHVAGSFSKSISTGEIKRISPQGSSQTGTQFTFNNSSCGPASCYALGPADFATIYNVLPLWNTGFNGTGQNIAIVGESNINLQDVRDFRSMFGLSPLDPGIIVDGPDPGVTDDGAETEALLDVEWAGAVAPGAAIELITSASTNTTAGVDLSALYAVDNNVAPVLSVSFGLCELFLGTAGNQFHSALWEQAAAQGITVVVASGDSGSAGCDFFGGVFPEPAKNGLAVSGFASTPFNVAVGGTDFLNFGPTFDINNPSPYWNAMNSTQNGTLGLSAKGYIPESTWNNTCTNGAFSFFGFESTAEGRCNDPKLLPLVATDGGSGGRSNCTSATGFLSSDCVGGGYLQPAWQTTALKDTARDVPDISLFASNGFWNSFYIICEADLLPLNPSCSLQNGFANFVGVGGTSAAAPAFAGMMALVNQFTNSKTGQGNANYELYQLASSQSGANCNSTTGPASSCIFNDVTFGTITVPCAAGSTSDCTVSVGGDKYGVLSGYDAGTGYDLATGLGSVNAFNLVTNWHNATFNSTTTILSLNGSTTAPVTVNHGSSVGVTVTVTKTGSVAGTPSGDVSLIASSANGRGVDSRTLSSGIASWNTDRLPGGNYNVHAHYAGDGTFGGSDSQNIGVMVTPESSMTSLNGFIFSGGNLVSLPSSVNYGKTVYLRADVTSATTHANGDTAPTGTVTFTDNGGVSQTYSLNSEGAAIAGNGLCTLTPGAHSFTASYSGDNSYQPSGSTSAAMFTVTQATPPVITLPSQIAAAVNSTIGVTVLVGGNINFNPLTGTLCSPAAPSGTVSLFDGATEIASSTIAAGGGTSTKLGQAIVIIQFSAAALPFGQSNITVKYSGDTNYSPVTSTVAVQVGFATTTMVTSPTSSVAPGANTTFTAQVTTSQSGAPPITGTIVFQVDFGAGTTVPVVNGTAQFTTSFPSAVPNSHKITASYSGDQNYIPSRASLQEAVVIPDFTLSDSLGSAGNIVIGAPGQSSAPVTLTISGTSDYNGTIIFGPSSCVITPAGSLSSCSFSPSSITGSGSTQLVINTTAPQTSGTPSSRFGLDGRKLPPIAVCLLLLLSLGIFKKQRRFSLAFGSVILLALLGLWACGGGNSGGAAASTNTIPGTPMSVPYTVTINAAPSGENSHTISLTFIVQ